MAGRELISKVADYDDRKYFQSMRTVAIVVVCVALWACGAPRENQSFSRVGAQEGDKTPDVHPEAIGDYLCTVAEKASIESSHLEDSGPPKAVLNDQLPTRFMVRISAETINGRSSLRLIELPYDGPHRDPSEWQTPNSVLHSPYFGNGERFRSTDEYDAGSFVLHPTIHTGPDGDFSFYHSGFEAAGGEDSILSIRWGRCKKA